MEQHSDSEHTKGKLETRNTKLPKKIDAEKQLISVIRANIKAIDCRLQFCVCDALRLTEGARVETALQGSNCA